MFECYFLKLNMKNNKKLQKSAQQFKNRIGAVEVHRLRVSLFDTIKNTTWPGKKNLEN